MEAYFLNLLYMQSIPIQLTVFRMGVLRCWKGKKN